MARPWRIEFEGALYHVLSRGNGREDIYYDDQDRHLFLKTVGEMSERFEIDVYAYTLMNNLSSPAKNQPGQPLQKHAMVGFNLYTKVQLEAFTGRTFVSRPVQEHYCSKRCLSDAPFLLHPSQPT